MSTCESCGEPMRRVKTAEGGDGWLCLDCDGGELHRDVAAACEALGLGDVVCNACGNAWWLTRPADEYAELRCPRGTGCRSRDVARNEAPAFALGLADALADDPDAGLIADHLRDTVAAACVYLGSILDGEKLTQDAVTDAAGVSSSALRQAYRDLYDASGFADTYGEIGPGGTAPEAVNPAIDVEGWRNHLAAKGSTHGAVKTATSNVRRFAKWYEGADAPTAEDVSAWLQHLATEGYAPSTIHSRWGDIRAYFEWAGLGELEEDDVDLKTATMRAWEQQAA